MINVPSFARPYLARYFVIVSSITSCPHESARNERTERDGEKTIKRTEGMIMKAPSARELSDTQMRHRKAKRSHKRAIFHL